MNQDLTILVSMILLWLLGLGNILFTVGLARRVARVAGGSRGAVSSGLEPGSTAPSFSFKGLEHGNILDADYLDDTRLLLVFLSYECRACVNLIPELNQLMDCVKSRENVEVLPIILRSNRLAQDDRSFSTLTSQLYIAEASEIQLVENFRISGTPSYCLIAPNGQVQASGVASRVDEGWAGLIRSWTT